MKTWKIVAIGFVLLFAIAAGVIAYFVNSLISGGAKDQLVAAASAKLGTKVDLLSYSLDFGSLLRLKPAVKLTGLTVANPGGFSAGNMIEAQEVAVTLDLSAAMQKRIAVTSLDIHSPKILIESDASGKTNLERLLSPAPPEPAPQPAAPAAPPEKGPEVSVGQITLDKGQVTVISQAKQQPQVMFRDLNLSLANLSSTGPCDIDLTTNLFESGSSQVKLAGKAGPFGASALPVDAKATVELPLDEIPAKARQEYFGELAADPGKDSRVDLDVALKGDLYQTAEGPGQIKIANFLIGPSQQGRLTLNGTAPLSIKTVDLISGDEIELRSQKATLQLGSGQWQGDLSFLRKAERLSGGITGSVQNVDVNQMLTSFAGTPNKVYGTLAIPQFNLSFAGAEPAELQRSLTGQGRLTIANGKFQGLSVLAAIERALGGTASGDGAFAQFATNFGIQKQAISMTGIAADGPGINITGQGSVTFNEALNFALQSKLTGQTAERLRGLTRGFVSGDLVVPVQIAGTLDNPQVRPDTKALVQGATKDAVKGVLDRFLGGKKN